MVTTVPLKSLTTGLVGLYPETHLGIDPDLVEVTSDEDQCVDCWQQPEPEPEPEVEVVVATNDKRKK